MNIASAECTHWKCNSHKNWVNHEHLLNDILLRVLSAPISRCESYHGEGPFPTGLPSLVFHQTRFAFLWPLVNLRLPEKSNLFTTSVKKVELELNHELSKVTAKETISWVSLVPLRGVVERKPASTVHCGRVQTAFLVLLGVHWVSCTNINLIYSGPKYLQV